MKLAYIVNINIGDKTARSVQVEANSKSFYKSLGNDFKLHSVAHGNLPFAKSVYVFKQRIEKSRIRRVVFHSIVGFRMLFMDRNTVIYSRNLSVLAIATVLKFSVVWEIHDSISIINKRMLNVVLKGSVSFIAISKALKDYLVDEFKIPADLIEVAHDAVEMQNYDHWRETSKEALRNSVNLPLQKRIILHSGSLYRGRGMEVFRTILENFPDVILVQVGGTPEDIAKWKAHYSNINNIQFISHVSNQELIKIQMSADICLLPMTTDNPIWWCTSPMKLFEYMATGNPIISTNIGSISEVLDSSNSLVYDSEDSRTLVEAINRLFHDIRLGDKISSNALIDVRNQYTWDLRVNKILKHIQSTIGADNA